MAVTSKQILDAIANLHKGGNVGRAVAMRRASRTSMNGSTLTSSQRQFVDDLAKIDPPAKAEIYQHPGDQLPAAPQAPGVGGGGRTAAKAALDDSDRQWLAGLPRDPSRVTFDDARQLLTLQKQVTSPSDRRLVDSLAKPVQRFHDQNRALAAERAAQAPVPLIPASALPALADAIASEVPVLRPEEAAQRARDAIAEVAAQRDIERNQKLGNAQRDLVELARQATEEQQVIKGEPARPAASEYVGPRA